MGRKRNNQFLVRLSDEEMEILNNRLKDANMDRNAYIRKLILGKKLVKIDGLVDMVKETNRIGVNLNQLTKAVNSGMPFARHEIEELSKELSKIWQQLKSLSRKAI